MKKIALIDLDKTLYDGYSLIDFMFEFVIPNNLTTKKNVDSAKKLMYEYTHEIITYNVATNQAIHLAAEIVKNHPVAEIKQWVQTSFKQEKLFPFCSELLELLRAHNFEIYLLSGTVEPVVSHIAQTLNIKSFASELEVVDGTYTGKVVTVMNEKEKANILKQLKVGTIDVLALGYGDSSGDTDFLKIVDHAFVLEPRESEVIALAEKNHWHLVTRDTIITTTKAVIAI